MKDRLLAVAVLAGMVAAGSGQAQTPSAPIEISLKTGFAPDPAVIAVTAGGPVAASAREAECQGYVSDAPTMRLIWTQLDQAPSLRISAVSNGDTILMVRDAVGVLHCDDDSGDDSNPSLVVPAASGVYEIWAGTYSEGERKSAAVAISPSFSF